MSDSEASIVSILDQYRPKAKAAEPMPAADSSPRAYRAYGIDAPQRRPSLVGIYYGDGRMGLMQKSFLQEVLFTSHQHLSLIFTGCIITLEGQHLDQLVELLQDEKILSLHCFNPKLHDRPAEGEVIITRIERRSSGDVMLKREKAG